MQQAIDVSNYSGSFSADTVAAWRQAGYQHIVCGTQRPEITRTQLTAALDGGMSADAYVYLYWSDEPAAQVRRALETIAGLGVGMLWLDCEDAPAGRSPEQVVAMIESAVAACGDLPHGIYTGRWWWLPSTGDSDVFAALPLWHAEYTANRDVLPDFDAFKAYGGWTRPFMWQFQGTTALAGVSVDLDLRDTRAAIPAAGPSAPAQTVIEAGPIIDEYATIVSERLFLQALFAGRYRFRPSGGTTVELLSGDGAPLQPPCIIAV